MLEPTNSLGIPSWALYVLGICLIFARIIIRVITRGSLSNLQVDDWIMALLIIPFTGIVICANGVVKGIVARPGDIVALTVASKMRFVLEELQVTTNWLVKACLLVLYRRILPFSTSRKERQVFLCTSAFCLLSYTTIEILLPLWCRPVTDYWSLYPSSTQCTSYRNHSILTLACSISTTLTVLIVPLFSIPTPRKFLVGLLLLLALLVLVSGTLARYYILVGQPYAAYRNWYVAETAAIILFANLPFLTCPFTSKSSVSRCRVRNGVTLTPWPCSYKNTPPLLAQRVRLSSSASTISAHTVPRSHHLGSNAGRISPCVIDEFWSGSNAPPSVPPTAIRKLTLTDPPPELDSFWTRKQRSAPHADVEIAALQDTNRHWPLR